MNPGEAKRQTAPKFPDYEKRIRNLRLGLGVVIEKARYDEYGSFEDVRNRIIALAEEILREDDHEAGRTR